MFFFLLTSQIWQNPILHCTISGINQHEDTVTRSKYKNSSRFNKTVTRPIGSPLLIVFAHHAGKVRLFTCGLALTIILMDLTYTAYNTTRPSNNSRTVKHLIKVLIS